MTDEVKIKIIIIKIIKIEKEGGKQETYVLQTRGGEYDYSEWNWVSFSP